MTDSADLVLPLLTVTLAVPCIGLNHILDLPGNNSGVIIGLSRPLLLVNGHTLGPMVPQCSYRNTSNIDLVCTGA